MRKAAVGHSAIASRQENFAHAGALQVRLVTDLVGVMGETTIRTVATPIQHEEFAYLCFLQLSDMLLLYR